MDWIGYSDHRIKLCCNEVDIYEKGIIDKLKSILITKGEYAYSIQVF